jgi:NAD dependent epimerase/dehydratase family enzyme
VGATGLVGGCIFEHLLRAGKRPLALSRSPQSKPLAERETLRALADAEHKIAAVCASSNVAWTILRPGRENRGG